MNKFNFLFIVAIILMAIGSSCNRNDSQPSKCVKGKLVEFYCDGIVVQIIDNHAIGKDWNGYNSIFYKNSVLASLDSNIFKQPFSISIFPKDSVFYFQYKEGGYPRLQKNNCSPSAFITIVSTSPNPCTNNK